MRTIRRRKGAAPAVRLQGHRDPIVKGRSNEETYIETVCAFGVRCIPIRIGFSQGKRIVESHERRDANPPASD